MNKEQFIKNHGKNSWSYLLGVKPKIFKRFNVLILFTKVILFILRFFDLESEKINKLHKAAVSEYKLIKENEIKRASDNIFSVLVLLNLDVKTRTILAANREINLLKEKIKEKRVVLTLQI